MQDEHLLAGSEPVKPEVLAQLSQSSESVLRQQLSKDSRGLKASQLDLPDAILEDEGNTAETEPYLETQPAETEPQKETQAAEN